MTRTGTIACCLAIGGSGLAIAFMAIGVALTLALVGAAGLAACAVWYVAYRRRFRRALRSMQKAWEQNRDATGGVT